ncbi:MAG: cysteine desulfurase family protein [Deltaproteobacteria bacterium]|nr:cysteine desulfurase family protein [Deltaproteobacteria bacterium]
MEIYLDNAATTRPWPEAIDAVVRAMGDAFGNASSVHRRGLAAARLVEDAKRTIAEAVGGGPWQVVFTSGGTESDNTAVLGSAPRGRRDAIVVTVLEHPAVAEACKAAAALGARIVEVEAGSGGVMDPKAVEAAVDERTALVSVIHVSNEIGTVQPVAEMARLAKRRSPGCRVHVDAVQALPRLARLEYPPEIDMVSLSGHKIHGPQGVGALLLRPGVKPRPLLHGGGQQEGQRAGTHNIQGIAGMAAAAARLKERKAEGCARMASLAQRIETAVVSSVPDVRALGDPVARAPGFLVLAIDDVHAEILLHALEARGVVASAGAACHSRQAAPSRALVSAGLRADEGPLRLSLSLDTTESEADAAAAAIIEAVAAIRKGQAGL